MFLPREMDLPYGKRLREILAISSDDGAVEIILGALFGPIKDFIERPSKNFRSEVVQLGYTLAAGKSPTGWEQHLCHELSQAIEYIHAGSLIVDDIQDSSKHRRGSATLHEKYNVPLALNAGNWLYFWPLDRLGALKTDSEMELALLRCAHRAMLRAHMGQALDLGTAIDLIPQHQVPSIVRSSLELKTGALMGLAIELGATVAKPSPERFKALSKFGNEFGVALQMFDDIGSFKLPQDHPKHFEDMKLRRPTWIWSTAAEFLSTIDYQEFRDGLKSLPDGGALVQVAEKHNLLEKASISARTHLSLAINALEEELGVSVEPVTELSDRLSKAY